MGITDSMNSRFSDILSSPISQHLVTILDGWTWLIEENDIGLFGDIAIGTFSLWSVMEKGDTGRLLNEWDVLKGYMIQNNPSSPYLRKAV